MPKREKNGNKDDCNGQVGELEIDRPFRGRATVYQPARGFKYSVDAYILTDFAMRAASAHFDRDVKAVDLGSGSGIVSIGLALSSRVRHITGIEIVSDLVELARWSACESDLDDKTTFIVGDYKDPETAGLSFDSFDLVVSNPPYRQIGEGRVSPDPHKAVAKHEVAATLDDLLASASRLLVEKGLFCVIFVSGRFGELLSKSAASGLTPTLARFVHPTPDTAASMVLLECVKGMSGRLEIAAPLFVQDASGAYTGEMEAIFNGPE